MTDRELLKQAMEALARAEKYIRPIANCAYNDNGDFTVTNPPLLGHDECITAYFLCRRLATAHGALAEALKAEPAPSVAAEAVVTGTAPSGWLWYGTRDGERYFTLDASTLAEALAEAADEYTAVAECRLPDAIIWHFVDVEHRLDDLDDLNMEIVDGDDDSPSTILWRDHRADVEDLQARINATIDAWVIERDMNSKIRPWAFTGIRHQTPVPPRGDEEAGNG